MVVLGEINHGDGLLIKRQERSLSKPISGIETKVVSERLVHFSKVLVKRMRMEIYPDIKSCGGE